LAIEKRSLDASQFVWEDRESTRRQDRVVSALVHRPTGYYFLFDFIDQEHWAERSPGSDSPLDTKYPKVWGNQRVYVYEWLGYLKREIEAPDLWAEISQETELAEAVVSTEIGNTPFTEGEQQLIAERLEEIGKFLATTQTLSDEQAQFVKKRLNYLADAASRLGRQDWLHTTIGVLFTIITGVALAPNQARELFRFATEMLRQVFGGFLPL